MVCVVPLASCQCGTSAGGSHLHSGEHQPEARAMCVAMGYQFSVGQMTPFISHPNVRLALACALPVVLIPLCQYLAYARYGSRFFLWLEIAFPFGRARGDCACNCSVANAVYAALASGGDS